MNILKLDSCFRRSGIAAKSDMETAEYKDVFRALEIAQTDFLAKESEFRSDEYKWPRDPLHCWSRIWEYPYVYHNLLGLDRQSREKTRQVKVVDLGSGVTFFPFVVAKLGYKVHCLDIDPVCERDIRRAASVVPHEPGEVSISLIDDGRFPLEKEAVDAVYCISVLEHIHDFENTINEVARILKHGGLFILTIDLDLVGCGDIGINRYYDLRQSLNNHFIFEQAEITIHPADMLIQHDGLDSFLGTLRKFKYCLRQIPTSIIHGRFRLVPYPNLSIWCGVMKKR